MAKNESLPMEQRIDAYGELPHDYQRDINPISRSPEITPKAAKAAMLLDSWPHSE